MAIKAPGIGRWVLNSDKKFGSQHFLNQIKKILKIDKIYLFFYPAKKQIKAACCK